MPPRRSSRLAVPAEDAGDLPPENAGDPPEVPRPSSRNRTPRVEVGQITNVDVAAADQDRKRKRVDNMASSSAAKTSEIQDAVDFAFDSRKPKIMQLIDDQIESLKREVVSEVTKKMKNG